MEPRLVPVSEQKEMISDDAVKRAFLRRDDIKGLSRPEQESRWQQHLVKLNEFRERLAKLPMLEIP